VVPDMARWVAATASPSDRIASYRLDRWSASWRYYVNRHSAFLYNPEETRAFLEAPGPFYCVMHGRDFETLVGEGFPLAVVHEREGMRVTTGRSLTRGPRSGLVRYVVVTRRQTPPKTEAK